MFPLQGFYRSIIYNVMRGVIQITFSSFSLAKIAGIEIVFEREENMTISLIPDPAVTSAITA